eukprot:c23650_g1_i1 orf=109-1629(+)
MGGQVVSEFTEEDSEVLVKIVKAAQSRQLKGSRGEWKDFLKSSKQHRVGPSDPAKRPWTTLADFVRTFTEDAHIQMVKQMRSSEMRYKKFEEFESEGLWKDSPEQELVRITHQHRRYKEYYTFPSSDEGWVMTDLNKADGQSKQEHMLSLDCEMVVCDGENKELVRVCVVDEEDKVLLDMLVKPTRPVIDYLTPITGICEVDLKHITCGFLDAQAAVLKLLTSDTILVGHSLHNDLKALKIDHSRVIDTSFLFQFRNKPESYNAGLNSLCKAILGHEFREDGKPHDCLLDATIPMKIVHHTLKHGIKGPIDIQVKMLDEGQLCKLYFHGIPHPVSVNDLQKLIPDDCLCKIDAISWAKNKSGTTYGVFSCIDDANRAFEELRGLAGEDSYGRPQKTVMVTVSAKHGKVRRVPVRVRKMATGDGVQGEGVLGAETATTESAQLAEDNELVSLKRKKLADGDYQVVTEKAMNHCCDHLREVESLRKQLKEKIEEVHTLQNIILDLTKG